MSDTSTGSTKSEINVSRLGQSRLTTDTETNKRAVVHVIDDDESPREALSLLFPSVGLDVRTYASVQEFLDADAHGGPGCIVLDVRLPGARRAILFGSI